MNLMREITSLCRLVDKSSRNVFGGVCEAPLEISWLRVISVRPPAQIVLWAMDASVSFASKMVPSVLFGGMALLLAGTSGQREAQTPGNLMCCKPGCSTLPCRML